MKPEHGQHDALSAPEPPNHGPVRYATVCVKARYLKPPIGINQAATPVTNQSSPVL